MCAVLELCVQCWSSGVVCAVLELCVQCWSYVYSAGVMCTKSIVSVHENARNYIVVEESLVKLVISPMVHS